MSDKIDRLMQVQIFFLSVAFVCSVVSMVCKLVEMLS